MACKGDSMPDRPHRRSALLEIPEQIVPCPNTLWKHWRLKSRSRLRTNGSIDGRCFQAAAISISIIGSSRSCLEIIKGPEPYNGGRRWTLRNCPFNPQHEKPAVIELAGGALVYKCLHKSCSENDWKALRQYIEPDYRRAQPRARDQLGLLEVCSRIAGQFANQIAPPFNGSLADSKCIFT